MKKYWETTESKALYWTEKATQPKQWSSDADAAFYHTGAWRGLRKVYIKNHPNCAKCMQINVLRKADVVDHINPIRLGGEPLAWDNLEALCHSCHNSKTAKERIRK